jgi:hypothetical protein
VHSEDEAEAVAHQARPCAQLAGSAGAWITRKPTVLTVIMFSQQLEGLSHHITDRSIKEAIGTHMKIIVLHIKTTMVSNEAMQIEAEEAVTIKITGVNHLSINATVLASSCTSSLPLPFPTGGLIPLFTVNRYTGIRQRG